VIHRVQIQKEIQTGFRIQQCGLYDSMSQS
jgi:hypothetical protein